VLIEDVDDPRVAAYRAVKSGGAMAAGGTFLCEGRHVVRRLLSSRYPVRSVLLTPRAHADLDDALRARPATPVFVASPALIQTIVGFKFHRGCLALGERGGAAEPAEIIAPAGPRLLLGLEELADPDNVGAVFRTAAAFGAAGVLLSPGCADPLYRKAIRVAMGATLTTPFARIETRAAVVAMREAGYTVVALTPDRLAEDIATVTGRETPRRLGVLLGSEGSGLHPDTLAAADLRVRIGMASGVDSLNVTTACGIALHRLASGIMGPDGS